MDRFQSFTIKYDVSCGFFVNALTRLRKIFSVPDFFNVSVDYLIGRTDVRYCADYIFNISSIEKEQQLLKIFRTLSKDKQEQAIGVLFALKTSE